MFWFRAKPPRLLDGHARGMGACPARGIEMNGPRAASLCIAALVLASAGAAQTPGTALCDGIAAAICGNRELAPGAKPEK
jgi:hypothetical protein